MFVNNNISKYNINNILVDNILQKDYLNIKKNIFYKAIKYKDIDYKNMEFINSDAIKQLLSLLVNFSKSMSLLYDNKTLLSIICSKCTLLNNEFSNDLFMKYILKSLNSFVKLKTPSLTLESNPMQCNILKLFEILLCKYFYRLLITNKFTDKDMAFNYLNKKLEINRLILAIFNNNNLVTINKLLLEDQYKYILLDKNNFMNQLTNKYIKKYFTNKQDYKQDVFYTILYLTSEIEKLSNSAETNYLCIEDSKQIIELILKIISFINNKYCKDTKCCTIIKYILYNIILYLHNKIIKENKKCLTYIYTILKTIYTQYEKNSDNNNQNLDMIYSNSSFSQFNSLKKYYGGVPPDAITVDEDRTKIICPYTKQAVCIYELKPENTSYSLTDEHEDDVCGLCLLNIHDINNEFNSDNILVTYGRSISDRTGTEIINLRFYHKICMIDMIKHLIVNRKTSRMQMKCQQNINAANAYISTYIKNYTGQIPLTVSTPTSLHSISDQLSDQLTDQHTNQRTIENTSYIVNIRSHGQVNQNNRIVLPTGTSTDNTLENFPQVLGIRMKPNNERIDAVVNILSKYSYFDADTYEKFLRLVVYTFSSFYVAISPKDASIEVQFPESNNRDPVIFSIPNFPDGIRFFMESITKMANPFEFDRIYNSVLTKEERQIQHEVTQQLAHSQGRSNVRPNPINGIFASSSSSSSSSSSQPLLYNPVSSDERPMRKKITQQSASHHQIDSRHNSDTLISNASASSLLRTAAYQMSLLNRQSKVILYYIRSNPIIYQSNTLERSHIKTENFLLSSKDSVFPSLLCSYDFDEIWGSQEFLTQMKERLETSLSNNYQLTISDKLLLDTEYFILVSNEVNPISGVDENTLRSLFRMMFQVKFTGSLYLYLSTYGYNETVRKILDYFSNRQFKAPDEQIWVKEIFSKYFKIFMLRSLYSPEVYYEGLNFSLVDQLVINFGTRGDGTLIVIIENIQDFMRLFDSYTLHKHKNYQVTDNYVSKDMLDFEYFEILYNMALTNVYSKQKYMKLVYDSSSPLYATSQFKYANKSYLKNQFHTLINLVLKYHYPTIFNLSLIVNSMDIVLNKTGCTIESIGLSPNLIEAISDKKQLHFIQAGIVVKNGGIQVLNHAVLVVLNEFGMYIVDSTNFGHYYMNDQGMSNEYTCAGKALYMLACILEMLQPTRKAFVLIDMKSSDIETTNQDPRGYCLFLSIFYMYVVVHAYSTTISTDIDESFIPQLIKTYSKKLRTYTHQKSVFFIRMFCIYMYQFMYMFIDCKLRNSRSIVIPKNKSCLREVIGIYPAIKHDVENKDLKYELVDETLFMSIGDDYRINLQPDINDQSINFVKKEFGKHVLFCYMNTIDNDDVCFIKILEEFVEKQQGFNGLVPKLKVYHTIAWELTKRRNAVLELLQSVEYIEFNRVLNKLYAVYKSFLIVCFVEKSIDECTSKDLYFDIVYNIYRCVQQFKSVIKALIQPVVVDSLIFAIPPNIAKMAKKYIYEHENVRDSRLLYFNIKSDNKDKCVQISNGKEITFYLDKDDIITTKESNETDIIYQTLREYRVDIPNNDTSNDTGNDVVFIETEENLKEICKLIYASTLSDLLYDLIGTVIKKFQERNFRHPIKILCLYNFDIAIIFSDETVIYRFSYPLPFLKKLFDEMHDLDSIPEINNFEQKIKELQLDKIENYPRPLNLLKYSTTNLSTQSSTIQPESRSLASSSTIPPVLPPTISQTPQSIRISGTEERRELHHSRPKTAPSVRPTNIPMQQQLEPRIAPSVRPTNIPMRQQLEPKTAPSVRPTNIPMRQQSDPRIAPTVLPSIQSESSPELALAPTVIPNIPTQQSRPKTTSTVILNIPGQQRSRQSVRPLNPNIPRQRSQPTTEQIENPSSVRTRQSIRNNRLREAINEGSRLYQKTTLQELRERETLNS